MLLCALTESTVLFIGAISEMPAVRVFALNAGFAILFNFILQITAFLALIKVKVLIEIIRLINISSWTWIGWNRTDGMFYIVSSRRKNRQKRLEFPQVR